MKKNSRLKSFFAILLAGSMIFQQSSLTVLATDDTYVEDATATPTPSESEAEAYTTEGAEPVAEKQEEPQQVQETPAAEQAQEPTEAPAEQPTEAPAEQPTEAPAEQPTEAPAAAPTETPATEPTAAPAAEVTEAPAAPEATATPAAEATATPTPEVSASPSETPTPTEAPKTSFRYEDSRVVITATAPEDANLPQDAEIKADYIAPGTERYNAAVAAFNSQLSSQLGLDAENTEAEYVLYDVYFLTADGSRIEPESGNVKVDMSFKQIQKSTIDGDVVNKDVVHLDNEGQAEVVTDYVNTNENGEVTGMGFTQGSFSIVGGVTVYDAESGTPSVVVPVSDNLNEFLDTAEIVNGEYENGKLVIKPGSIYEFKLSFKEKGTTLQYDDSKETLEYTFDSDLTPEVVNGSGTIKGTENGIPYSVGFTYTIENNKVKIKIDKTDPNYQELIKASNAKLEINLKAKVSETISKVDTTFWTKVNKDILIDKSSSVTIDKQGTYDEENGKFDYVVTVTAKGNPKDITVTDTISGSLLKLTGNIEVESSKTGKTVDGSFDTDKKTESGFTYKIKQMTDNEKIAFKYSATVDRSGKKDGEKFTKDETSNKVTATGKEIPNVEKEHSFENTTVYDYPISKSGELTGEVTSDGKQTITWTIIVNEGAKYNVGGSLVTDKLGNTANVTLEYSGDGLTIQRMDENNVDSGKAFPVLWKDLKEYSSKDHWKYELPADDKAYAYKITYTTVADVSKLISDGKTVTNDVDFKGNHEKGTVPVGPKDDSFKVDKTHGEFDKNSIHYTVTVNVPKAGFEKYLKITDTLPGYNNNGWQADEYIDKTLEIKLDGKTIPSGNYKVTYVKSSNQQGGKLEVLFEEEAVNKLFSKSETEKTLTITYKTKPGWTGSQPHYNTVKVEAENGSKEDTDSVIVADRTIVKEFVSEEKAKDGLPVYCFRVFLTGVDKETIELEDSFDKSLLELYEGKDKIDQWNPNADQYDKPHFGGGDEDYTAFNNANGTSINGEVVEHTPTENGIKFKLKASKKEGGNDYYGYYCLRYKLKVIDEDALAKIIANAKNDNNGVYTMANTASWGTDSASATVDYKYGAVTKSVVKATLANGYKATYSIKINEGKQLLNNGEKMLLEDFLNSGTDDSPNSMVFLPNSFKIFFDGVEQSNYHINYDETSKKLSFYVPDATKVEIQYDVKIVGTGDVKYSNYAVLKGQYSSDVVSESTNISSSGTGSAEHFGINIYKYGSDDITKGLKNVKFKLYVKENDSFVPVTEIVGNKRVQVEVTTNDQGYAVLNGTVGANGWEMEIGKTYKLEESSTPTGYKKSEPIIFTTSYNSTSADIQTPNSTINVENEKVKTGKLTVKKSVEAPEGFNAKKEYEFTVTDTAGNQYNASGKQEAGAVIRLKDGGSVTLENLPEGTYTVIEKTAGEEGYLWKSEVTVTGKNTEEATTASAEVTDRNETTVSFKNIYSAFEGIKIALKATKSLAGRDLEAGEFKFGVTAKEKDGISLPEAAVNDEHGNIVFREIGFTKAGTYHLTVKEQTKEDGIAYDESEYAVIVKVKAGEKTFEIEQVSVDGKPVTKTEGVYVLPLKTGKEANFENHVKLGKLTVKKSVEAPEGFNAKKEYEFTVTDTAGNQYNASGKQEAGAVIRLKDGGSVTLENLPEGTYTVIEKTAGEEGYLWKSEVTVTGKNTEEATTASAEVTDGNETTVSFKNTYKKFTEVELQLNAKKNLTGRALTEDEFEFLVTSENKVGLTLPGKIFTNDKNGNIVITGIVFSEEGRYILTVEEKKGENAGITYDSTKYNVTVNVKANAEGDLKTEIESIKKKGEEKNENQIVFNNIYTATANFTLTASKSMKAESEQLGTFEFELSGDNIETQTVTNNEAGAITFAPIHYNLSDVGNTYTYTVREKAPSTEAQYKTDGIKYVYDTTVYTVKVKVEDNGDGTLKLTKTVKIGEKDYTDPEMRFVNDTTKATITKVDALGNQLSGVELEVRDKNNEVVDSWTTSTKENPHVITGKLILGETYKLVEKSAPAGYTLADPVEFTVSENDIDNKVEMKNTYSASGSLNLTAKKTLTTTETPLAADQFTFELRDKDGTVLQTKTNDADGNVTFDEIKYSLVKDNTDKKVDNTGEYQYTVNEVKGDAAGYTYDDTIYTINVTVTDAGNGTLTVTPVIHSSKATSEDATVTGMEFTNTYTTSGQIALGAIKTLEGQTLEAEQFSFQATEMDADGKAVENGYNETVKNADGGAITFPIITYKESGTHYYQITEVKDEKPAYQYDESKYVVKVDVTDDNAGKLTAKVTSVTKNGEPVKSEDLTGAVTFTNTYSASADLELKAQKSMKVEAEQLGTFEFELKDADGKVIETVKNDEKGAISFSKLSYTEKDAGKTFTYTVNEKLPSEADTYVYDKTVYTVTVNVEDNRDGTLKLTTKVNGEDYTETAMKFVNDTTKVTISKVDDTTLKALAGAKLQVVDDQDKVVEEWTSDGTPHVITAKLVLGKTYKLVEAEAPSGYEIAEPITFTVDADDTKNAVEMKDAMTKGKTAAIEITKELKLNDALAGAKDMTFYAALFADAECTIPASDVKALEFKNASSSTVTFTNLDLGRTYYVSETDVTGKAIDSGMTPDEKVYVPVYPQGQAITVTEDGAKSSITFENQFSEWPDGFYKIATLNVTKKLLGADGNALESDEIFYAGIFDDKECTTLSTRTEKNILTLDLAGGSTVSESTQAVVIPDEAFTLYVAETDAEGNLVDGTDGFRYAVTVENGNVLFDENNLNAEVTIINQEQPEATPTVTPEETITPTPTPGTSTGVKTGDDTPIGFYMALLFVAALAIEETTRRRRKKEQD